MKQIIANMPAKIVYLTKDDCAAHIFKDEFLEKNITDKTAMKVYLQKLIKTKLPESFNLPFKMITKSEEFHGYIEPFVEGQSLLDVYEEIPVEVKLKMLKEISLDIREANERGFYHTDIRMENIMINSNGFKIIDTYDSCIVENKWLFKTQMSPGLIPGKLKFKVKEKFDLMIMMLEMIFETPLDFITFLDKNPDIIFSKYMRQFKRPLEDLEYWDYDLFYKFTYANEIIYIDEIIDTLPVVDDFFLNPSFSNNQIK